MNIYFMTTPRALKDDSERCNQIFNTIEDLGHKNVTDFLLDVDSEKFYNSDIKTFYKKTIPYIWGYGFFCTIVRSTFSNSSFLHRGLEQVEVRVEEVCRRKGIGDCSLCSFMLYSFRVKGIKETHNCTLMQNGEL